MGNDISGNTKKAQEKEPDFDRKPLSNTEIHVNDTALFHWLERQEFYTKVSWSLRCYKYHSWGTCKLQKFQWKDSSNKICTIVQFKHYVEDWIEDSNY